jgi:VanZ family protein
MRDLYQKLSRIMPYIFVFGLVVSTYLLLREMPHGAHTWTYKDKLQHIAGFFVLASAARIGYPQRLTQFFIGLALYGALMEVLQGLLTVTREASVFDWVADVIGILLCIAVAKVLQSMFDGKVIKA